MLQQGWAEQGRLEKRRMYRRGKDWKQSVKNGRGERIRTSGLTDPNRALYQAELRPDSTHQE